MTDEKAYGAIFCMSGTEKIISQLIHYKMPDVRISPALYDHFRVRGEKKVRETAVFMPGYVFFQSENNIFIPQDFPRDRPFRLLKDEEGDWRLRNKDLSFARWLFSYDAYLPLSMAYEEGTEVTIMSGPLKDLKGCIRQVDRAAQQGLVEIYFHGQMFRSWLGFEVMKSNMHVGNLEEGEADKREVQDTAYTPQPHIYTGMDFPGKRET